MLEIAKDVRKTLVILGISDGQSRAETFLFLQSQTDDGGIEELLRLDSEGLDHQIAESVGINESHFREMIAASDVAGLGDALEIQNKIGYQFNI